MRIQVSEPGLLQPPAMPWEGLCLPEGGGVNSKCGLPEVRAASIMRHFASAQYGYKLLQSGHFLYIAMVSAFYLILGGSTVMNCH